MKLSELVKLLNVSICGKAKKFENLAKWSKRGDKLVYPSQIGSYLTPVLQMREV
jgi:hypothetical protein